MKKLIFALFCALTTAAGAQTVDYNVSIAWPGGDGRPVRLTRQGFGGTVEAVDSAVVAGGAAALKGSAPMGEYMLEVNGVMERIWIDAAPSHVEVLASPSPAVITGDDEQTLYQQFDALVGQSLLENIRIGTEIRRQMAASDSARVTALQAEYAANNNGFRAAVAELIEQNPNLLVSALILGHTTFGRTNEQIDALVAGLSPEVRNTPYGHRVSEAVALRQRTAAGAPAMEFELSAPDGSTVNMSDLRGRWVLLDFWASFCVPCLRAAPTMREIKAKYGDRLAIVGISLDTRRELWTGAIESHDLNWIQATSLKGWECPVRAFYGVEQMPALVLVDPEGRIVNATQTLRAETLDQALGEVIK